MPEVLVINALAQLPTPDPDPGASPVIALAGQAPARYAIVEVASSARPGGSPA